MNNLFKDINTNGPSVDSDPNEMINGKKEEKPTITQSSGQIVQQEPKPVVTQQQKSIAPKTFSQFVNSEGVQKGLLACFNDQDKKRFTTSIISAVSQNPELQNCDFPTILSAAMQGASLNLSCSPAVGGFFIVPFNDNKNNRKVAQFQIGFKGYIQLAIRSGVYKKLNAISIKEGELISYDPLNDELKIELIKDDEQREKSKTIGYYAFFQHHNGFTKSIYWSKEKTEKHALKYSKGYAKKKGYTFWEKDFDSMGLKTVLRQLLSKWGSLSPEMEEAMMNDMAVIVNDKAVFADNGQELPSITNSLDNVVFGQNE